MYWYAPYFGKMLMVMNLYISFRGKKCFLWRNTGSSRTLHCDITCSEQTEESPQSVSLYMGDVKNCCKAKGGFVFFTGIGEGVACSLLLLSVLLVGEVQCGETKVHFL